MMAQRSPKNIAASVRQRLLNHARDSRVEFERVLMRHAIERWLYRLGRSEHRDRLILKGAHLFTLWTGDSHRSTRDLDFLGAGNPTPGEVERIVTAVCGAHVEPEDGMRFLIDSVRAEPIRAGTESGGVRVTLRATLAGARVKVQIDVGFGDPVIPAPERVRFPSLLNFPAPEISACPRETVAAEKFEAIVRFGIANTRIKDFADLNFLADRFEFEGVPLRQAIEATFAARRALIPHGTPAGLSPEFANDPQRKSQWRALHARTGLPGDDTSLEQALQALRGFLLPVAHSLASGDPFEQHWPPGGPWS